MKKKTLTHEEREWLKSLAMWRRLGKKLTKSCVTDKLKTLTLYVLLSIFFASALLATVLHGNVLGVVTMLAVHLAFIYFITSRRDK